MTTEYASFDELATETADDGAEDFTLSSGKTVRLRGLTRAEHLWIGKGTEDAAEIEARMLSKAMIQPPMSLQQAKSWQATGKSNSVAEVTDKIRELSGFGQGAAKSDVREVRDES